MFSFSQFITEGRDAPLYHGTSFYSAIEILRTNSFQPRTHHLNRKLLRVSSDSEDIPRRVWAGNGGATTSTLSSSGISLSRSKDYSLKWNKGVLFELDQRKLAQDYKIIPINYWNDHTKQFPTPTRDGYTESEEFLIAHKAIHPADKYIIRFWITQRDFWNQEDFSRLYDEDPEFVAAAIKYVYNNKKLAGTK